MLLGFERPHLKFSLLHITLDEKKRLGTVAAGEGSAKRFPSLILCYAMSKPRASKKRFFVCMSHHKFM